ncbi:MAG: domain containing protein [Pedosphaera sp.]|nr:domain containing protein [Pedosphaera sp.]
MKRLHLITIHVAVLLAGWLALSYARSREPRYEGRTLTQWLEDYYLVSTHREDFTNATATLKASAHALKQIGTNAIPSLLKKLSTKNNAFEQRLESLARSQSLIRFHYADPDLQKRLGFEGFRILGKDAMSAVPALTKLIKHPGVGGRLLVLNSLDCIQPKSEALLPILLQNVHDPEFPIRIISVDMLSRPDPEAAEKPGVYKEVPRFKRSSTNNISTNVAAARKEKRRRSSLTPGA